MRIEGFVRHVQNVNQKQHLPVFDLSYPHFDFGDLAPTEIPSGFLKFSRKHRLGPAAPRPDSSHLASDDVLVFHPSHSKNSTTPTNGPDL